MSTNTVPQGGQFTATVTVTNNTAEPVPVDLWLVVTPGDSTVALRDGRPNVVPAGGVVVRSYTHTVDEDFRPGRYTVTVNAGDFGAGTVLASDSYFLRITTPVDRSASASAVTGSAAVSPNPFTSRAALTFSLDQPADVRLSVYDVLGREVAVLLDGQLDAGVHTAAFEAGTLAPGTYVYRLTAGGHVQTGRMTLAR